MKKKWIVADRQADDLIEHLLKVRGIADKDRFLHPQFEHRHDQHLLIGLPQATMRISKALKDQEIIGLYGDYDCDGIPGTALMYQALVALGATPKVYIPTREAGYGLSNQGIDILKSQGVKVLITIDNGTTAYDQINYAQSLGIDVIVTDHHEPHGVLPKAIILNPKLEHNTYPFSELCGTGVIYKLLESLSKQFPDRLSETWLKWHLDLVALATICDMVELTGENRIFTKFGMTVLQKTRNIGLQALLAVAGADQKVVSVGTVGFGIGPRINAAGRMDSDPLLGFTLLTTNDQAEALRIANELHRLNLERQQLVIGAVNQAEGLLQTESTAPAIALQNSAWTPGILGLIASKLLERYHKPVFIFNASSGKGSARSISDYPLPASMEYLSEHFVGYGGHALAGGMTLKQDAFSLFKRHLYDHAGQVLGPEERQPQLHIDAEIKLPEISTGLTKQLADLEPYGIGNPRPLFLVDNVSVEEVRLIGSASKHVRGIVAGDGLRVPFVAFGMGERKADFRERMPLRLAGKVEENTWNGSTKAELHVVDVDAGRV